MENYNIQPIRFIKENTDIEVKFIGNNDKLKWFKGVVKTVSHFGIDELGEYIKCMVEYEDGELVKDSYFYNKDFENENSSDAWRLQGNISLLLRYIVKNEKDIESLRDSIQFKQESIRELINEILENYDCCQDESKTNQTEEEYSDEEEETEDETDEEEFEEEPQDQSEKIMELINKCTFYTNIALTSILALCIYNYFK